ncbi:MAG: DegT/DnrJ/EryC1/StrS family aminotransferase [bacterium]|nr:DegT/DnrJ/EryC1/StrS family aminotransferase [bacterium]
MATLPKKTVNVPFADLSYPTGAVKKTYIAAVKKFLDGGNFILSKEVEEFEKKWAKYCGADFALGLSSGGDAIYVALKILDVGKGDEVITQGNAYNATVTAIMRTGAKPRFADIDPETLTINPEKILPLINEKTKVILPVHLYGLVADMERISKIAEQNKLFIVEDCAQAHGAKREGKKAGIWSEIAAWSFYPTKNLGAFGEAGAITTKSEKYFQRGVALRNLGQEGKNNHKYFGFNMRLDGLEAIALSLKLPFLNDWTEKRIEAAEFYDELIDEVFDGEVAAPPKISSAKHIYHLYAITLKKGLDRNLIQKNLSKQAVQTAVHYPVPVYKQPFFAEKTDKCPITEDLCSRILSLPIFFGITRKQQKYVVESLRNSIPII